LGEVLFSGKSPIHLQPLIAMRLKVKVSACDFAI
jgi:hypothetical protein